MSFKSDFLQTLNELLAITEKQRVAAELYEKPPKELKRLLDYADEHINQAIEDLSWRITPDVPAPTLGLVERICGAEDAQFVGMFQRLPLHPRNHLIRALMTNFSLISADNWRAWMVETLFGETDRHSFNRYIFRPGHSEAQDEVSKRLRDIQRRLLEHILDNGGCPDVSDVLASLGDETLTISAIGERWSIIQHFAAHTRQEEPISPKEAFADLTEQLRKLEVEYEADCGSVGDIAQMREVYREALRNGFHINICDCNQIWTQSESDGWVKACPFHGQSGGHWFLGGAVAVGNADDFSEEEVKFIRERAPKLRSGLFESLSLIYDLPLNDVQDFMLSDAAEVARPARELCAFASDCPTLCAKLQREGGRSMPITADGLQSSCYVAAFFECSVGMDAAERGEFARVASERLDRAVVIEDHGKVVKQEALF